MCVILGLQQIIILIRALVFWNWNISIKTNFWKDLRLSRCIFLTNYDYCDLFDLSSQIFAIPNNWNYDKVNIYGCTLLFCYVFGEIDIGLNFDDQVWRKVIEFQFPFGW